jgi:hypothetical protein
MKEIWDRWFFVTFRWQRLEYNVVAVASKSKSNQMSTIYGRLKLVPTKIQNKRNTPKSVTSRVIHKWRHFWKAWVWRHLWMTPLIKRASKQKVINWVFQVCSFFSSSLYRSDINDVKTLLIKVLTLFMSQLGQSNEIELYHRQLEKQSNLFNEHKTKSLFLKAKSKQNLSPVNMH